MDWFIILSTIIGTALITARVKDILAERKQARRRSDRPGYLDLGSDNYHAVRCRYRADDPETVENSARNAGAI